MQYIIKVHGSHTETNEAILFELYDKLIRIKNNEDVVLITPTGSLKFFTEEDIDDVSVDFTIYSNEEASRFINEDLMCLNYDLHSNDVIVENMMLMLNSVGLVR